MWLYTSFELPQFDESVESNPTITTEGTEENPYFAQSLLSVIKWKPPGKTSVASNIFSVEHVQRYLNNPWRDETQYFLGPKTNFIIM